MITIKTLKDKYEKQILELFKKGLSTKEISKSLKDVSQKYVWSILKENNISVSKRLLNDSDEKEIIEMYEKGMSAKEILTFFPKVKSENTIISCLKRNNIPINRRTNSLTKNTNYFKNIDSEKKAYFLGLLITDGSVYKSKYSLCMNLTLKEDDEYLIYSLRNELGSMNKISKNRGCSSLTIYSKELCEDLISHNVVFRKSLIMTMPKLEDKYISHFLRGVFDGNGSFTNNCCVFYGTYEFIKAIKEILINKLNVSNNKITIREKGSCSISFGSLTDRLSIYNFLYKNASIYMKRKHDKMYLSLKR